jgi:hypothetical protein
MFGVFQQKAKKQGLLKQRTSLMTDHTIREEVLNPERLLFRRQFLLAPKSYMPNKYWHSMPLSNGLFLSVHVDLPFVSKTKNDVTLTLLGHVINPLQPDQSENEIVQALIDTTSDLDSLIELSKPFVGRWVLLVINHQGMYLFTDPCGFRQVFYYSIDKQPWCASQPELIKRNCPMTPENDASLTDLISSKNYIENESPWIGSGTIYHNCFHLMPNHFLDVGQFEQVRFWPRESSIEMDVPQIVELAGNLLKGTITALTKKHDVALALTAGWDSRVLFAASMHVKEHVAYFVYQLSSMPNNHPDLWVAEKMAECAGVDFEILKPDMELPEWFTSILSQNVTCARTLPKTHIICHKLMSGDNRMTINGNGSEICRNHFDKYGRRTDFNLSKENIAAIFYGKSAYTDYATKELDKWLKNLEHQPNSNFNILDLLYWEQRLGNWGAQFPAEQDVAIEEISPFNCRLLLETLMFAPRKFRTAPNYHLYKALIRHLCPELLSFPVNPPYNSNVVDAIKLFVHTKMPATMENWLKKHVLNFSPGTSKQC